MTADAHPNSSAAPGAVPAHLGLWDAVSLIVGIVIGSGIYETAPFILNCVASPAEALLVWILGGVLSVVGALCYAELATTYPRQGGDYHFLRRAYGPGAGFLFAWTQLTVLMTGSIGLMAFVFADYAVRLFGTTATMAPAFAVAAVIVLSAANVFGLKSGQRTQNLLSLLKIIGLTAIVLAGFLWPRAGGTLTPATSPAGGMMGLAMILVLFTYGGWNDAAFIVAEMRESRRNIPRALVLGTGGVAVIYLLINLAYLNSLGFDGARQSKAIAAEVLHGPLGDGGARAMALLVMISALGAMNGIMLSGARIYSAAGEDFKLFAPLARWHPRLGTPVRSVLAQSAVALAMILLVGTSAGRTAIDAGLRLAGVDGIAWEGHGGFDSLLKCTSPVFWLFFLATGISLFVLRRKDGALERQFRVPLFPLLPLMFCGTCVWMLYSAVMYAGALTLVGLAPALVGSVIFQFSRDAANPRGDR